MKTRRGTAPANGTRSFRNKTCATEKSRKGRKKINESISTSNDTRVIVQSSSRRKRKPSSSGSVRRSKPPQNHVQVRFNLAKEYSEDELFLLRRAVYMQQYDPDIRAHNQFKPIVWFTVTALINVDEWTWDAVQCMKVWRNDQEASSVRVSPFSAAEDDLLLEYGKEKSGDFWYHISSVFKRDPGEVYSRWTSLRATRSHKDFESEIVESGSESNASSTPDPDSPDASSVEPVNNVACDSDIPGGSFHSCSNAADCVPDSTPSPACAYKPIRKSAESTVTCKATYQDRNNHNCDSVSVSVSGGEETWEGSVSSSRSVIFPFSWDSVSISATEDQQ